MERFLKLSGIPGDRVRQMLGERKFYGGQLGFILDHEPTLMSFCADTGHGPMSVSRCYAHFVPVKSIAWT
jgi:hypothetical protein